ncbi:class I SAM-dependent methyltransferase [Pasteurella skyensis]|uniref:Class I SAM-dependent methyltransferase n=1 Tax=Phocoenobacter skyensis TaxID=97481 RepID=A0AAJ6P067_9PAST|nr:class I SAM-dependent methyltransferase [Pasteurella skyensis]MDP8162327.1 class I SAM-dependent methyltransferase [Pasteurella skyensis]MDP8172339.1 class I SAM-dependent methyltransferase [Pasteurella skyensis]MDP8177029.1 class I SAM-dependent methyltransferase [Pasteurella skyensis]MDP8178594.1 class I SAM-dependent methyltransferase [Pasteurella skyensis]MDP8182596.1 class I SAM-dependent methyltransferase [Pasteurella skyensis]
MIEKQSISNTLYIPLIGNIYTSKNFKELLFDEKALELEKIIPQNNIKEISDEYYYLASASRYYNMDLEIKSFIKKYPKCNIVNIGAGLDTSFYRIKSDTAVFYEIDLPPVINERRQVIPEQEKDIYIECSFLDVDKWIQEIKQKELPTLLIISGVFYYFKEKDIADFFTNIKNKFTHLEAVFDCNSQTALKGSNRYVKKTGNNAPMYFYINDIKTYLNQLGMDITLINEYMMYYHSRKILKRTSLKTKIVMFISDLFKMVKIEHIKIN